MASVNLYEKTGHKDLWDIVKFQLMVHCSSNDITLSDSELQCLTLLAINKQVELNVFCNMACYEDERILQDLPFTKELFKTPQSVRNVIGKLSLMKLISKEGPGGGKTVKIHESIDIQIEGNILVTLKYLRIDGREKS